jgi:hypothetical protein
VVSGQWSVVGQASRGRESAGVRFAALLAATASVLRKCGRFTVVRPRLKVVCPPSRVPHHARPLYPLAYGGVLQAVGLTRSREGAKGNAEVSGQRAFFEYEYEYRCTEYEYEGKFFGGGMFFAFFVLVLDLIRTAGSFLAGGCPGGGNDRVCQSVISEASRGRESAGGRACCTDY